MSAHMDSGNMLARTARGNRELARGRCLGGWGGNGASCDDWHGSIPGGTVCAEQPHERAKGLRGYAIGRRQETEIRRGAGRRKKGMVRAAHVNLELPAFSIAAGTVDRKPSAPTRNSPSKTWPGSSGRPVGPHARRTSAGAPPPGSSHSILRHSVSCCAVTCCEYFSCISSRRQATRRSR